MTTGYLYILFNPSLRSNQFKIGKTTRDPRIRAYELSRASGVPQPYEVLFALRVENCEIAERMVHARLAKYRLYRNREFFNLTLERAIEAVQEASNLMEVLLDDGLFDDRLHAAGEEVYLVARGAHFDAIRRNGLVIETNDGAESNTDVQVTDDPNEIGPVDIVLFAVKLWATVAAGQSVQPLIGANTAVISLQNGIDSVDILTPILGAKHVIGGETDDDCFLHAGPKNGAHIGVSQDRADRCPCKRGHSRKSD